MVALHSIKNSNLSPEDQLLLCCARTKTDEITQKRIERILLSPLDWNALVKAGSKHRVCPLIYSKLINLGINDLVPKKIVKELQNIYYMTNAYNIRLFYELKKILGHVNNYGIKAMFLKGPIIGMTVYKNPSVRPMGDLDMIINERDFHILKDILTKMGYTNSIGNKETLHINPAKYAQYFEQIRFFRNGITVETHFRLINMGIFKKNEVNTWKRAINFTIDGNNILAPSHEDFLFYLCLHAAQHNYLRLILFCDIAEYIREFKSLINWSLLIDSAKNNKAENITFHSLFFTKKLLGTDIPQEVMDELKPNPFQRKIFDIAWNNKKIISLKKKKRITSLEIPFCYLFGIGKLWDKILYISMLFYYALKWLLSCKESKWLRFSYLVHRIFMLNSGK